MIHYTLPDPLTSEPRKDCVYAVLYRFPGGHSWTLHRNLASATGKVGGMLANAPGEWYRDDAQAYLWRRRAADRAEYTITVEEREVCP